MTWSREDLARRAAKEVVTGTVVNLGIGIPTLVANLLPADAGVMIHSENGLLGMGPFPLETEIDPQLINAGKQLVTAVPGGSCFDSALLDQVDVPGRNFDIYGGAILRCRFDAGLAAESTIQVQIACGVKLVLLVIAGFVEMLRPGEDLDVAGCAGTDTATGVVKIQVIAISKVEN